MNANDLNARSLANAINSRDNARAEMNRFKVGSRRWLDAEDDLNFWQGKVANLQALVGLTA